MPSKVNANVLYSKSGRIHTDGTAYYFMKISLFPKEKDKLEIYQLHPYYQKKKKKKVDLLRVCLWVNHLVHGPVFSLIRQRNKQGDF